jgi:hypothetical protein
MEIYCAQRGECCRPDVTLQNFSQDGREEIERNATIIDSNRTPAEKAAAELKEFCLFISSGVRIVSATLSITGFLVMVLMI